MAQQHGLATQGTVMYPQQNGKIDGGIVRKASEYDDYDFQIDEGNNGSVMQFADDDDDRYEEEKEADDSGDPRGTEILLTDETLISVTEDPRK